jgi:List-Bact-rpt repeat protein
MAPWIVAAVVLTVSHLLASPVRAQLPAGVRGPVEGRTSMMGRSAAMGSLPLALPAPVGPPVVVNPRRGHPLPLPFGKPRVPDSLVPATLAPAVAQGTPAPTTSFDGLGSTFFVPPDPNGDVGPDHYVQTVNAEFAIFDKSTGALLAGPTDIADLFTPLGFASQCFARNDGDPVVVYDRFADRWVIGQIAVPDAPAGPHICIAVSQTADPSASYFLYDFAVPGDPDYLKIGVWPDGYYLSTAEGSSSGVYALDRSRMLQGLPASFIYFSITGKNFLLPSHLSGPRLPPVGAPNYFYTFTDGSFPPWGGGLDRLDLLAFHADFTTPSNSTLTPLPSITITPFNYTVCGYFVFACIPQPAPGEQLDAVSEWPMWRFFYRNLGTHEALVGNFTVDVTGGQQAGIRWFELRKAGGGNWTLFQEGTHAPDASHRWMGSIAMDGSGDIALGYSVSSVSVNPSLRYATRVSGAAPGTLETEATLVAGGGVQTAAGNRWGDYSAMTIDPADDCTFWYTGEYYVTTSLGAWSTRIGAFRIPSCVPALRLGVTKAGNGSGTVTSADGAIDCGSICSEGVAGGTPVSLTASPASNSNFVGWSGGCGGTGSCVVTVSAPTKVTATFALKTFTLAVVKTGTGTGTVVSSDGNILCGATCSEPVIVGAQVTLNATPSLSSSFSGWSGAGCSGTGTCTVTMTAAATVTAVFTSKIGGGVSLTVTKLGSGPGTVTSGDGTINCGPTCAASYAVGTPVTLTAAPGSGAVFKQWGGGCSGAVPTCVVTLATSQVVTATFTETFTDGSGPSAAMSAGTVIKLAHLVELRTAIDTLRAVNGLGAFPWTDPAPAARSTPARSVHFIELRTALSPVCALLAGRCTAYTDASITPGQTIIRATHVNELRANVRALE